MDATNQASKTMRAVIAAMHAGGVARINMVTDGANGYQTSTGYHADQNLTVTVMKVGTTGKLTAAGLNAGATANYGPGFSSGARHAGQSQAIRSAVADARSKADAAAAAAGLHVTGVISVSKPTSPRLSEYWVTPPPRPPHREHSRCRSGAAHSG